MDDYDNFGGGGGAGAEEPLFDEGGAVRGGRFYGTYPVLETGGAWDVGGGRIIPTTSADQYAATLASWFGVPDQDLTKVAPSINNFTVRNLGFMG